MQTKKKSHNVKTINNKQKELSDHHFNKITVAKMCADITSCSERLLTDNFQVLNGKRAYYARNRCSETGRNSPFQWSSEQLSADGHHFILAVLEVLLNLRDTMH
jgi:hypothetical protein